jgi:hypothetical protein
MINHLLSVFHIRKKVSFVKIKIVNLYNDINILFEFILKQNAKPDEVVVFPFHAKKENYLNSLAP